MSLTKLPYFSVIMATYGRGAHIAASIKSVLAQSFDDFELIVVGDNCADETAQVVANFGEDRIRWINLPTRWGSQSGPNNAGIAAARGKVIAYLGHDDIWEPDHLADLARLFNAEPEVDFGVAGMLMYLPTDPIVCLVTGMFDGDAEKLNHFFPPSGLAHRRSACEAIGLWRKPYEISPPVDADFQLRAAAEGLKFASTQRISVHKFGAAARYLSYLAPSSDEQEAMLLQMQRPDHAETIASHVARAREGKTYMTVRHMRFENYAPGEIARINAKRKGLLEPAPSPLAGGAIMLQGPSSCSLDWEDFPIDGVRWTKRNPKPRVLLPFCAVGASRLRMQIVHSDASALVPFDMKCNGVVIRATPDEPKKHAAGWSADFRSVLHLQPKGVSVVELYLAASQTPTAVVKGIGLGYVILTPTRSVIEKH
jgi:glycosyltransferase involved in cell wall biosynthesis